MLSFFTFTLAKQTFAGKIFCKFCFKCKNYSPLKKRTRIYGEDVPIYTLTLLGFISTQRLLASQVICFSLCLKFTTVTRGVSASFIFLQ